MNLVLNMLLQWEHGSLERLLWFNTTDVVVIDAESNRALPRFYPRQSLIDALLRAEVKVVESDEAQLLPRPDDLLTASQRQHRDQAWSVIRPLVEGHLPDLFIRQRRGKLVAAHAVETGVSKTTLYGYLRRYWQRGQIPNALVPDFQQCGGAGKRKAVSDLKRGHPRHISSGLGVNIDAGIRQRFRQGVVRFYESGESQSLRDAYQRTLEHYFNHGYQMQDNVRIPVLPPADELPTFRQFRYWFKQEQDLEQTLVKREGQNRYNRQYRPLLSESTGMAFGPGSVYQIDATVGDVYLVSELNPQHLIGRPVIYFVVDVFSRMVVGLSVTLEGPSWLGAMLALENAAVEKTGFCARYGVTLSADEWPAHYLPEMLLADRGELEGYNADHLAHALNIVVSNTAPYRADMKGIVEQCFRLTNLRLLHNLPGAVREQERGNADYRLEARLTLSQLTTLLIRSVLYHNRYHVMADYPLAPAMLRDGIEPRPLEVWQWGIQHRSGHLRTLPLETLRLSLLPQAEATITRQGIRFRKLYYTCSTAVEAGWFVRAGRSGRWSVRVSYDPRLVDWLYLWQDNGRRVEVCSLLDHTKQTHFQGLDWDTVRDFTAQQTLRQQSAQQRQVQGRAVLNAHTDHVVQQTDPAEETTNKSAKLRGIRDQRQHDRTQQRSVEAWRLADNVTPEVNREADEDYIPPAQYLDLLRGEDGDHDNR